MPDTFNTPIGYAAIPSAGLTAGRIPFIATDGRTLDDDGGLAWDDTNKLVVLSGTGADKMLFNKTSGGDGPRMQLTNTSTGTTATDGTYFGLANGTDFTILSYDGGFTMYTGGNPRTTLTSGGTWTYSEGVNMTFGTTTGTKIGTTGGSSGEKIGFFNATPIVQPLLATGGGATVDNVITVLQNLGLCRQS